MSQPRSTAATNAPTILVAEDSPVQATLLRRVLSKAGFDVTLASDGAEALRIARDTPPDLIISDVVMPAMNGLELCQALRAFDDVPRVPVLLLTSLARADDILSGLAAGADDYLIKPYDDARLLAKVTRMLAPRPATAADLGSEPSGSPIGFEHDGRHYRIPFRPRTILRLLTSTYEHAVRQNEELIKARQAVHLANQELEAKVAARTSELSRANEQLEHSLKLLYSTEEQLIQSEKLTAVGTMVGGIVHEINNPIMGAMNYVQYAIETAKDDDLRLVLNKAEARIEHVAKLVNSMLHFVRRDDAGLEAVDPRELLDETLALMEPELKTHQVEVVDQLPATLPSVCASRIGLQQVVANLIKNAIDALEGHAEKRIHIHGEYVDGQVLLAIADNGSGVPEEFREQIFDAFFTTKPKGKGTGLGLAICQRILHSFGASIRYRAADAFSQDRPGACFEVWLPRLATDAGEQPGDDAPTAPS